MKILEHVKSICPVCFLEGKIQKIDAEIIEEETKVWMVKQCQKHGSFKEIYWNDIELYNKWMHYKITGEPVADVKTSLFNDPQLYNEHTSQPMLTNLIVTNRCNLQCSYCYLNAGISGYVYEPTMGQLRKLMQQTRNEKPIGSQAIQITGGEPTLRDDLIKIIRLARQSGFKHIQLHTNGLRLAKDLEYCRRLKNENVNTIYLSFNGTTEQTNPLINQNKRAIENLRNVKMDVVLVPVLIGGNNIQEAGKIVRFAIDNLDIVRGVHFQPISFCGRAITMNNEQRKNQRVDYINILECIEKEFSGELTRDDFYPTSFVFPILKFIEIMTHDPQIKSTAHPGCGGSTLFFIDDGKLIPVPRFVDIEADMKFLSEQSEKTGPLRKLRIGTAFIRNIHTFVDYEKAPKGFDSKQLLKDASVLGSRYALRNFYFKSLFVGFMWHQDPWNLNIDRLQRCVIHCPTPEGIIPFCSYIGLGYGEKIHKKYSLSIEEWEKKNNKKLQDDICI